MTAADARQELLTVMAESPVDDTRVLPTLNQPSDDERPARTWVRATVVAVAACLLAVAVGTALLVDRQGGGTPAAAGSPTPSIASPSTPPSPTPSAASPSAQAATAPVVPRATTPVAGLAAFRTVVLSARRTALLEAQSTEQLLTAAEAVAKALERARASPPSPGPSN